MANPMKAKGDRAERAVEAMLNEAGLPARRTRAGRREDEGDILGDFFTVQVKDVKTPVWSEWVQDLDDQKAASGMPIGFLTVKRSRPGKPPLWLAVLEMEDMIELLHRLKESDGDEEV